MLLLALPSAIMVIFGNHMGARDQNWINHMKASFLPDIPSFQNLLNFQLTLLFKIFEVRGIYLT